jgi:hypothetical protein
MKLEFFLQIFEKYSNSEFHKNSSSERLFHAHRRADRHDEANSRCSQFCELAQKSKSEVTTKGVGSLHFQEP